MKISTRKITWMSASFAFAVLTGMPAIADDTELLLMNPDPSQNPKPNVMFILDTSGSMSTLQNTTDPYDSVKLYAGDCDPDKYYFTDVDVTPDCATSTNIIDGDKYFCDFATKQINGIGSYTDTHIQLRPTDSDADENSWQELKPGFSSNPVECQADSGSHGNGSDPDEVYADNDSGIPIDEGFEDDFRK